MGLWLLIMALLSIVFIRPAYGVESSAICFSEEKANRLLRIVEKELPDCRREVMALSALDNGAGGAIEEHLRTEELLQARANELIKERDACIKQVEKTKEAGEKAVDAVRGTWWDRVLSAGKWVASGIAFGVAVTLAAMAGR